MNSLNFLHKIDDANPTTFAWVNSFLGAECNPLIPAVTYDKLGLPGPQTHILQVTCPRDGECDFSQGPALQTIISSHTLRESPFSRLTEPPLIVQHLYLWPLSRVIVVTATRKLSGMNECLEKSGSMLCPAQWSFLTMLIEELLLQAIDFSVRQMKSSILMSLCHYFANSVLSNKRPVEETNLRQAITSIFLVLKGREWAVIFKLIDAYKDTLKLLR